MPVLFSMEVSGVEDFRNQIVSQLRQQARQALGFGLGSAKARSLAEASALFRAAQFFQEVLIIQLEPTP